MHNAFQCVVECMLQWITQLHMHIFAHLFISTFPILLVTFIPAEDLCAGSVAADKWFLSRWRRMWQQISCWASSRYDWWLTVPAPHKVHCVHGGQPLLRYSASAVEEKAFHLRVQLGLEGHRAGDEGGEPGDVCQGLVHPDLQAWHILCPWDLQNRQAVCICWWLGGAEWKWWGPASITTPAWVCSTHYLVRGWRRWDRYRVDGEEIITTNDEEPSSYQNQMLTRVWITSRLILHNTGVVLKTSVLW